MLFPRVIILCLVGVTACGSSPLDEVARQRAAVTSPIGIGVWEHLTERIPSARKWSFSVAVTSRNAVWIGGGNIVGSALNDLWEWNGSQWKRLPDLPIAATSKPLAVYDPLRDRVLYYADGTMFQIDVQTLDVTELYGPNSPKYAPSVWLPCGAWDVERDRFVLACATPLDPAGLVREWSDLDGWTDIPCVGHFCPLEVSAEAAYDPVGKTVLAFGGYSDPSVHSWNGSKWLTSCETSPCSLFHPEVREGHAIAFDPASHALLMFGGLDLINGGYPDDLWRWNGSQWSNLGHGPIGGRHGLVFSSVPGTSQFLFFGGSGLDDADVHGDTWKMTLGLTPTWELDDFGPPPARTNGFLAYDDALERTYLFGGEQGSAKMWSWAGTEWIPECTPGTLCNLTPSPPAISGGAFLRTGAGALLFGGTMHNGVPSLQSGFFTAASGWSALPDLPQSFRIFASAFDWVRNRVVIFGGLDADDVTCADTYALAGNSIVTPLCNGVGCGAPARESAAMAHHVEADQMILFGGVDNSGFDVANQTWELVGNSWVVRATAHSPPARHFHQMMYDPRRQVIILFGGQNANGALADTWEYDGVDWREVTSFAPGSEHARILSKSAGSWDDERGRLVVFGGETEHNLPSDRTLEYHVRGNPCGGDLECDTGHCVDGVCCESSLCAPCETCAGPEVGVCTKIFDGVDAECAGVCGPTGQCGAANGATCSAPLDCASTYCSTALVCAGPAPIGASCGGDADCDSNHCVDGVCCDSACDGQCQRCDLPSALGACTNPVGGDPDGECFGAGDAGCLGTCGATGACVFPASDTRCSACLACDGKGSCSALPATPQDNDCPTIDCATRTTECRVYGGVLGGMCIAAGVCADVTSCAQFTDQPDGTACAGGVCSHGECVPRAAKPPGGCAW